MLRRPIFVIIEAAYTVVGGGRMYEHLKIGEFLVSINAMTAEQRDEVLRRQGDGDTRLFGEIAVDLGYVEKSQIRKFFSMHK